jgi:capsid protein
MPWIDPMKEAQAAELLERNFYASAQEIIRRRGGNPQSVIDQESAWHQRLKDAGLDRVHQGSQNAPAEDPADDPQQPEPNNGKTQAA